MIELYHAEPNIYYLKPLIALKEKNASFQAHYFDPTKFEQFGPNFPRNMESDLQLEREGPVLVDGSEVISSSFFMLEYVADAVEGPDLNPGEAYNHYRARAWGQFLGLSLGPIVGVLGCAKYLAPALKARDQQELKSAIGKIEPVERRNAWMAVIDGSFTKESEKAAIERSKFPVKRVEDWLGSNPWMTGPSYSISDIDTFALLAPLADLAPEVVNATATPKLVAFLEKMRGREAVQAAFAMSKTGKPQEFYVPGAEPSRWG